MPAPSREAIVSSYRQLYTHALRATQYSSPARQVIRNRLRHQYRTGSPADYDARRIENTLELLRGAAAARGLEHKLVKQIVHVWWWEEHNRKMLPTYVLPFRRPGGAALLSRTVALTRWGGWIG